MGECMCFMMINVIFFTYIFTIILIAYFILLDLVKKQHIEVGFLHSLLLIILVGCQCICDTQTIHDLSLSLHFSKSIHVRTYMCIALLTISKSTSFLQYYYHQVYTFSLTTSESLLINSIQFKHNVKQLFIGDQRQ